MHKACAGPVLRSGRPIAVRSRRAGGRAPIARSWTVGRPSTCSHCLNCQTRRGSAFAEYAMIDGPAFAIEGDLATWTTHHPPPTTQHRGPQDRRPARRRCASMGQRLSSITLCARILGPLTVAICPRRTEPPIGLLKAQPASSGKTPARKGAFTLVQRSGREDHPAFGDRHGDALDAVVLGRRVAGCDAPDDRAARSAKDGGVVRRDLSHQRRGASSLQVAARRLAQSVVVRPRADQGSSQWKSRRPAPAFA